MPTKTAEQKMAEIYNEIGFDKFRSIVIVLLALNKPPRKERTKKDKTTRKEQEGFTT